MVAASSWLDGTEAALRPPPRLSLSEWADKHFVLSAESAAEPGRWRTLPYQRGIMDAITDPATRQITVMKSARIGYTKMLDATIGYYMHQDPCPILVVQPTVEDAQGFSKEEVAPMLRDCDVLRELVREPTTRVSESTILHKTFPGGSLSMVGANSGRGFRRVSRRVVLFDEIDGYPPSAGSEGDQIKLGMRRAEYYWDPKFLIGSTPLLAGTSRIEQMFEAGDRRRYHVPCPQCGHMDFLVFRQGERGHWMQWPEGEPEEAHFVCSANGCVIEHAQKRAMLEGGEWVAEGAFRGHASFHVWTAYSLSPNATWAQIASEFVEANKLGPEKLKTFVNTVLGETWHERGEAPEWERLYNRREGYAVGTAPAGVRFLTAGVDVQKDRFVYEVVGWSETKESWSVDAGVLLGDTAADASWKLLDELLGRSYPAEAGGELPITALAVDTGYNTQQVYTWCRGKPGNRVLPVKGTSSERRVAGVPKPMDVTLGGRRLPRGLRVWPVGVGTAKTELYGWLRLPQPGEGEPWPPGYCHLPSHPEEFFRQLTAEQLVTVVKRNGFQVHEWQILPGRENHWLDCRVYARAAAYILGLDRMRPREPRPAAPAPPPAGGQGAPAQPQAKRGPPQGRGGGGGDSWGRGRGSGGGRGRGWFDRRR